MAFRHAFAMSAIHRGSTIRRTRSAGGCSCKILGPEEPAIRLVTGLVRMTRGQGSHKAAEEGIVRVDAMKIDMEEMEDAVLFPFFETSLRSLWPRLLINEHTSQQSWKRDILSWMLDSGYREIERNRSNAMLELNP